MSGSHRMNDRSIAELQEAGERLAQANEDIQASLAAMDPIPPSHRTRRRRTASPEPAADRERRKRQRVGEPSASLIPGVEYGWEGRVVPGKLTMDVVSVAPGQSHSDPLFHIRDFDFGRVLHNTDPPPYVSGSSALNIVLRHRGETTFSLDRLNITVPKESFPEG